ncbi:MAG: histone deacetylase family protein [Patescibacteria group bacterium]|nr:histone deacetylase family protein [Patescibacteria group bacterium]
MSNNRVPVYIPAGHHRYHPPENCPETPERITLIAGALEKSGLAVLFKSEADEIPSLTELHSSEYLSFLKSLESLSSANEWKDHHYHHLDPSMNPFIKDSSVYPFPSIWRTALSSANTVVDAVKTVRKSSSQFAFALARPPGHHAGRSKMGGFCYLANSALAVILLRKSGRIAVLDLDFHHGDGTQELFYTDPDVLTISIHGDPRKHYPFTSGFETEKGEGKGYGTNRNFILLDNVFGKEYCSVLEDALASIRTFAPAALVVSLGFDTFHRDPLGSFSLDHEDYSVIASRIARLHLPTIAVLEGGYHDELGQAATSWVSGFLSGRQ